MKPGVVVHAFNAGTQEAEAAEAGGFLSSRTARALQRNPVSKNHFFLKKRRRQSETQVSTHGILKLVLLAFLWIGLYTCSWFRKTY